MNRAIAFSVCTAALDAIFIIDSLGWKVYNCQFGLVCEKAVEMMDHLLLYRGDNKQGTSIVALDPTAS